LAGALIVTAEFGPADFAWFDRQRREHFPAERNQLPAHLTLFHALPPSALGEAKSRLSSAARRSPPHASVAGLMNLGGGVAYRIHSPELEAIREQLSEAFHGLMGAQDSAGWRPHVTIQNKVDPKEARALFNELEAKFEPRPLALAALALHEYLGGPWAPIGRWPFRL
jgi:hypothetical protein